MGSFKKITAGLASEASLGELTKYEDARTPPQDILSEESIFVNKLPGSPKSGQLREPLRSWGLTHGASLLGFALG